MVEEFDSEESLIVQKSSLAKSMHATQLVQSFKGSLDDDDTSRKYQPPKTPGGLEDAMSFRSTVFS